MTPKEKAKEIASKMERRINGTLTDGITIYAKQCSMVAVGEILKIFEGLHKPEYTSFDFYEPRKFKLEGSESEDRLNGYELQEYWNQVKTEIEKL